MLVEHATCLPEGAEWEYEYSWPGERVLAAKNGANVRLIGAIQRRDLTNRFPVIAATIAKLTIASVVIDGVVRAFEAGELALFGKATEPGDGGIRFIATDVLAWDALDARQLPLVARRERLAEVTANTGMLSSFTLDSSPTEMLRRAGEVGADGVIAKRKDSRYRPFARLGDWVRVPIQAAAAAAHEAVRGANDLGLRGLALGASGSP